MITELDDLTQDLVDLIRWANMVVNRWEEGDLAEAVRGLDEQLQFVGERDPLS